MAIIDGAFQYRGIYVCRCERVGRDEDDPYFYITFADEEYSEAICRECLTNLRDMLTAVLEEEGVP